MVDQSLMTTSFQLDNLDTPLHQPVVTPSTTTLQRGQSGSDDDRMARLCIAIGEDILCRTSENVGSACPPKALGVESLTIELLLLDSSRVPKH